MSLPDTIFIFALALVIFGPKKLPEIGRQIGKLVFEFRRASNEFKMQIEEELRAAEQADRQKKLAAEAATQMTPAVTAKEEMTIRPPSTGVTVSTESPTSVVPREEEVATLEEISSTNPVPDLGSLENGSPAIEPALESASVSLPAAASPLVPEPQTILSSPGGAAESSDGGLAPRQEAAALEAVLPAAPALTAEEHIQEQIAIHHG